MTPLIVALACMAGAGVGALVVIRTLELRFNRLGDLREQQEKIEKQLMRHEYEGKKIGLAVLTLAAKVGKSGITDEYDIAVLREALRSSAEPVGPL